MNNYFNMLDPFHPFLKSSPFNAGSITPPGVIRGLPPQIKKGFWPCEKSGEWVNVEDHRGKSGYLNGVSTTITTLGPLPSDWKDTPPELRPEDVAIALQTAIINAIQARLDDFARTRNYDGILSACTYATSQNHNFRAEGQYCVEARDAIWAKAYKIMDAVESGERPLPTVEEVISELPELKWPEVA